MKAIVKLVVMLTFLVVLTSCASTRGTSAEGTEAAAQEGVQTSGAQGYDSYAGRSTGGAYGTYDRSAQSGQGIGGPEASAAQRVVYFDFDSAEIRADSRLVVEANARYLTSNPGAATVLEGHTDERGSREYNIGLGERRAEAVRQLMIALGVSAQQLRTVSYGEERPAMAGHDEAGYAQNRRVEITY